jgi:hypothetical protein
MFILRYYASFFRLRQKAWGSSCAPPWPADNGTFLVISEQSREWSGVWGRDMDGKAED